MFGTIEINDLRVPNRSRGVLGLNCVWRHLSRRVCVCALCWYSSASVKPFCRFALAGAWFQENKRALGIALLFLCFLSASVCEFGLVHKNLACGVEILSLTPYRPAIAPRTLLFMKTSTCRNTDTERTLVLSRPSGERLEIFPYQKGPKQNL